MKKIYLLLLLAFTCFCAFAKPIDRNTAMLVGKNYLQSMAGTNLQSISTLQLAYTSATKATSTGNLLPQDSTVFFYVFNLGRNKGFVIVSGDDEFTPVLGYSFESHIDPANIPASVVDWLEGYKNQMQLLLSSKIKATAEIENLWTKLKSTEAKQAPSSFLQTAVSPLLKTTWDQSPYYNDSCPGGSVTGCVATAMAQVMKYWSYPLWGSGTHSYDSKNYGTLSRNFSNSFYFWSLMPNSSSNSFVAGLMYDLGVSVNMNYSPKSSGAYVIAKNSDNCSENALKKYFGYDAGLKGLERSDYSDDDWLNLIKTELAAGRPVLYTGSGTGGAHCFVADGFDASNNIHFNFGWGGSWDGYFTINAVNPVFWGIGGGSGGYNNNQKAVIGVQPPAVQQTYDLRLYAAVSRPTILYGIPFSVTTDIVNNGNTPFSGDFCAAVFDASNNIIDSIEVKKGFGLAPHTHYSTGLTFSTNGLLSALPGKYTIGILYRPPGGQWRSVTDYQQYVNYVPFNVVNNDPVKMYKSIAATPASFTKGQPASVNFDIVNTSGSTYKGTFFAELYNLDGTLAQRIGYYSETAGLPNGSHYLSPFLTLSTPSVTVDPGTYLLTVTYYKTTANGGFEEIAGTGDYQNPIKIVVQDEVLNADVYEANNTAATAYTLPVVFTGNAATASTAGANVHVVDDQDYYKVILPAGYKYTIRPRLNDTRNSSDGKVYTLDGIYTFSLNGGITWSPAYDDLFPDSITVNDPAAATTLLFHISPYFAGFKGTYQFNAAITRQSVAPTIAAFTPASAVAGAPVTITGTNFTGTTAVSFGGVPASSFTVISATSITAVVASGGASGAVSVTTPYGTAVKAGFLFNQPPIITSFSPASAGGGQTVTITGSNFTGIAAVSFGDIAAQSFTVVNSTTITAVPAIGGASGNVSVTAAGGSVSKDGFTFIPLAPPGMAILLNGVNNRVTVNTGSTKVSGNFTVEAWVRPADPTAVMNILSTRLIGGSFDMKLMNGNLIHGDIGDSANWITNFADANFSYKAGTWYHIAYVVTTNGYTIYANGNAVGAGSFNANPRLIDALHQIQIGALYSDIEFFNGSIDEVRVYSTALTQANIQADMVSTGVSLPGALQLYYNFDQPTDVNAKFADYIIGFSSQYSESDWSAKQALGAPNVFPAYGDNVNAWASANSDDTREYLELGFKNPSPINFIDIYQTFRPGAIDTIYVKNPNTGKYDVVYTAAAVTEGDVSKILHISFPLTSYPVGAVRIALNSGAVSDWNEIDAVKIGYAATTPGTIVPDLSGNGYNGTISSDVPYNFTESYAMAVPATHAATKVTAAGFTANWTAPVTGIVDNYLLDVATDEDFASILPDYNAMPVSGTSQAVTGLTANTRYFYRLRADKASVTGQGAYSDTVAVTTLITAITSFNPASAAKGATVTITGTGFTGATAVSFGGIAAASFTVVSDNTITAVVGAGGTGIVSVEGPVGTGTKAGFTFVACSPVTPAVSITASTGTDICGGTSVIFTAKPVNGGTPVYQWYKSNTAVGSNSNRYKDAKLTGSDSVWCIMTSSANCLTNSQAKSNVIVFTITPKGAPRVIVTANPGTTICAGTPVTLTANTTNAGATPKFVWRKNGAVAGSNSPTYTDNSLKTGDSVTCTLTTSAACILPKTTTSTALKFTVNPVVSPVVTIATTTSGPLCAGVKVSFTATVANAATKTVYKWYKNGVVVGGTGANYSNVLLASNDSVWCIITSTGACVASPNIKSNVYVYKITSSLPPTLTITNNATVPVCPGTPVTFTVMADAPLTNPVYQWFRNDVPTGSNQPTYVDEVPVNGESIKCNITETLACTTTTGTATTTVPLNYTTIPVPDKPSAITGLVKVTANQASIVYSVTKITGLTYNWLVPAGVTIVSGQGTARLTVNWGSTAGTLNVTASNSCGAISSASTKAVSITPSLLPQEGYDPKALLNKVDDLRAYPNPVTNAATIAFTASTAGKYEAQVLNSLGQLITSKEGMTVKGLNTVKFDMARLSSAMYYIRLVDTEHGTRVIRLVKGQ